MKILITLAFVLLFTKNILGQKIMTEGTISYNLSVTSNAKDPELSNVFEGATLNVYIKGYMVLQELKSVLLNQTTVYDGKKDSAIILKQSGDQKYIINLSTEDWQDYNKKYIDIVYNYTTETKTVAGYVCKKAIAKLKDGTEFTVWFATGLILNTKGYDYQFKVLPGVALEYEVYTGSLKVNYTASKITFNPIPNYKFDIPKIGYRILKYQNNN